MVGDRLLAVARQRSLSASAGAPGETRFARGVQLQGRADRAAASCHADPDARAQGARARPLALGRAHRDRRRAVRRAATPLALRHELGRRAGGPLRRRRRAGVEPTAETLLVFLVARDARGRGRGLWRAAATTTPTAAEIKRMFVRRAVAAPGPLARLLERAGARGRRARLRPSCRLETGDRQPEAMAPLPLGGLRGDRDASGPTATRRCRAASSAGSAARARAQPSGSGRGGRSRGTTSTATIAARISAAPSQETARQALVGQQVAEQAGEGGLAGQDQGRAPGGACCWA